MQQIDSLLPWAAVSVLCGVFSFIKPLCSIPS